MEKIEKYQKILTDFLEEYGKINYANAPLLEQQVIIDTKRNHFELVSVGWQKGKFIHDTVFHFDIKENKIWIIQNWTDIKVSKELINRGVEASDIVIGFIPVYA
jgi:XisI protein